MHYNWIDSDGDEGSLFEDGDALTLSVWNDNGNGPEVNEIYVEREDAKKLRDLLKQWLKETK